MIFGSVDATTGNLVDLAQYQFWGVMIAMVIVMPFMVWMVLKYNGNSHVHMIDRLAIPMDGMKHSVDMLAQQLAANTASMNEMLKNINDKVNGVANDVDDLKSDVDDLKDDVHEVAVTVKEHGAVLEDHTAKLSQKQVRKPKR